MGRQPSLVLKNVQLPQGRIADVTVGDGIVKHIGAGKTSDTVIDCTGFIVLPAAVDIHVHMRGGTQSAKEDWKTASMSALAGGVTVVVDQPNTVPPLTTPESFTARVREALADSFCSFAINGGVSRTTPYRLLWNAGAMAFGEIFFAASSYGEAIDKQELTTALAQIRDLGALATIHVEEVAAGPDNDLCAHDAIRSPAGELRAVRTVRECNTKRCRLHFCHMSTAASVDVVSGTVEVTPHHLLLSYDQFARNDTFGKVNPPLRSEKERKKLWSHWKRIDVIASDHAPHTESEKRCAFSSAPSGIPGVETMVPLLLAEVLDKKIPLHELILKTSQIPARVIGIKEAGFTPGNRGDFALYPAKAAPVRTEMLHSKCRWTPYEGRMAVFPLSVIMGGVVVFNNGDFFKGDPQWIPGKGYTVP
jgi:dihydroorotase